MTPKFTICRLGAQDKVENVDKIITRQNLTAICCELTGQVQFDVHWLDERIKGKMFTFETDEVVYFITYTPKIVGGRNSYLQSVPTAFGMFLSAMQNAKKRSEFCLYFSTPFSGNNQTRYHQLIYKLLLSMHVRFLNITNGLKGLQLKGYNDVLQLIEDREQNRGRNSGNQSSYITDEGNSYHIYGKTFGANQKETTMLCTALCSISDKPLKLFQIADNDSEYLSSADIQAIGFYADRFGKHKIDILDDTYEFDEDKDDYTKPDSIDDTLRSPRFIYNLLRKSGGHKKCALCGCEIDSIVQGAHIYPVCAIKRRSDLQYSEKLEMATDENNGLWLCENHHKLFDRGLIRFEQGKMIISDKLDDEDKKFIEISTPTQEIMPYTDCMSNYFAKRDEFYHAEKIY